jgi:ribonucleoside-diphosphate reductase alpha chain
MYDDGRPGEVYLQIDERGTTLSGFCICTGILLSLCLQYGVSLDKIHEKLSYQEFEPNGMTDSTTDQLRFARSIIDYVVRWMMDEFATVLCPPASAVPTESSRTLAPTDIAALPSTTSNPHNA